MRLLESYFKDVLEVNKNTELLEYLETNLLGMVEYQVKLENFVKQSSLDDEFIKNKLLVKHARFKSMLNEIVSNPYNIVYELNDEEKKIERFFKSDKIYSTNSNTINIIGEYRKLTSFASKLFENVKSIKFVLDDLENQKNVLEILNQTIEVFRRAFIEYSSITNQIDLSVKNFEKFSRECIDIGENAK